MALVYCHHERWVDAQFADCLALLLHHDGRHRQRVRTVIPASSGPRISRIRNDLITAALVDPAVEWVFLLDTDMTFACDALDALLATAEPRQLPILGGITFAGGASGTIRPTVYTVERSAAGRLECSLQLGYPADRVFQVHATGAACLLVHRRVFEAVHAHWASRSIYPWFQETQVPPDPATGYEGDEFGEDVTFCLRAGELGFPVHIDSRVKFGHNKVQTLDEASYVAYAARTYPKAEPA